MGEKELKLIDARLEYADILSEVKDLFDLDSEGKVMRGGISRSILPSEEPIVRPQPQPKHHAVYKLSLENLRQGRHRLCHQNMLRKQPKKGRRHSLQCLRLR